MNEEKKTGEIHMPETFKELSYEWLSFKAYKIKRSTFNKYQFVLDKYVLPELGEVELPSLHTQLIDKFMVRLCETHDGSLSHSSIKTILYLVKAIIKFAEKTGYIQKVYVNFEIAGNRQEETQVLSDIQEKRLVKELLEFHSPNNLGIFLSLYTGIRLGEVCALMRKDLDFAAKTMRISRTAQRLSNYGRKTTELIVTQPKSQQSKRVIPLPDFLVDILYSYEIDKYSGEKYVLSNKEIPYEPRTLQYAFQRVMKKCGISNVHFHCLRHTFATRCVQAGYDTKTLSEILGHFSVSFTIGRYVHTDIEVKRKQMELIDARWQFMNQ